VLGAWLVSDLSYSYASTGSGCTYTPAAGDTALRTSMTDNKTGQTTRYCYDQSNRLVSASTSGGDSFAFQYDASGSRTQVTKNGAVVQSRSFNTAAQVTTSGYAYDGAGNLTNGPEYGNAAYNGSDQMTGRTKGDASFTYTYAGSDQTELVQQTRVGGQVWTYTFGRTAPTGMPLLEAMTTAAGPTTTCTTPTAPRSPCAPTPARCTTTRRTGSVRRSR
jgi:YD repeat-containing protein